MEETKKELQTSEDYKKLYVNKDGSIDEKTADFANKSITALNKALELREQSSIVFNGIPYSQAYEYNRRKAINYAPPKSSDDKEVSYGIPHEKIVSFCAIFLKYFWKRRTKCRDENGQVVEGLGTVYDLAIEHSYKLERFKNLIALIYWELFSQGNAFVYEDWEVRNEVDRQAIKDGKVVGADDMEYTFEFLDGLDYKDGEEYQTRRAVSRLLDGRQVIFSNPEFEDLQQNERIWLEFEYDIADAEAMFGSLSMWDKVPKTAETMTNLFSEKSTLFNSSRLKDASKKTIVHYQLDKTGNTYNLFVNGVMMLPRKTPFRLFYPRNNYPLTNIPAERLTGSVYCRGIPAKVKFNSDFIDWSLKMLAYKFEQGVDPALLVKGKYLITKDMFKGGQRTHGVKREDYEKADPENKGITNNEVTFVTLLKQIVETQTVNATTSGEVSANATATEIATLDQNQRDKLGFLLDGLLNGFTELYQRRAETIESKYTIKQKETIVDGKKVAVYQNFTVSVSGVDHSVIFDDVVGQDGYDIDKKNDELFTKSFMDKKKGKLSEYHLVDPRLLRDRKMTLDIEVFAEKVKDSHLQMIELWNEIDQLLKVFGTSVNQEELKKLYLETSNRSDNLFTVSQVDSELGAPEKQNMGSFGGQKPRLSDAVKKTRV